jgi:hypothetical protein
MNLINKSISHQFPLEVIIHILEYSNHGVKYRNGKFIDQIDKKDERYYLLYNLPKIETIYFFHNTPFYYIRNLGEYEVKLKKTYIDDLYPESQYDHELYYQLSFYKKRKQTDNSIILYNYIIR